MRSDYISSSAINHRKRKSDRDQYRDKMGKDSPSSGGGGSGVGPVSASDENSQKRTKSSQQATNGPSTTPPLLVSVNVTSANIDDKSTKSHRHERKKKAKSPTKNVRKRDRTKKDANGVDDGLMITTPITVHNSVPSIKMIVKQNKTLTGPVHSPMAEIHTVSGYYSSFLFITFIH